MYAMNVAQRLGRRAKERLPKNANTLAKECQVNIFAQNTYTQREAKACQVQVYCTEHKQTHTEADTDRGQSSSLDGDIGVAGVVVEGLHSGEEVDDGQARRPLLAVEEVGDDLLVLCDQMAVQLLQVRLILRRLLRLI